MPLDGLDLLLPALALEGAETCCPGRAMAPHNIPFEEAEDELRRGEDRQERQRNRSETRLGVVIEMAVDRALDRAMPRVFETLGIDMSSPAERKAFRDDLAYMREMRMRSLERKRTASDKAISAIVGAIISGALAFVIWIVKFFPHT